MLFNPLGRQRRITQPTLIVQGTADKVVAPGNADVLAGLFPTPGCNGFMGRATCPPGSNPSGSCAW
jgi:pimeloyl-ACP methyl ester carboxylesterase